MAAKIAKTFEFASLIEKLKKIERYKGQFYWRQYPKIKRYESVADHSWRVSVLVLLFSDNLGKKFNIQKALKMALIHDLPEILTGDKSPLGKRGTGKDSHAFNKRVKQRKKIEEKKAATKLFNILPRQKADEFYKLWQEYESQKSFEARVVKAIDAVEAMLQVFEYRKGKMFRKHLDFTLKYCLKDVGADPEIEKFAFFLADKMKASFKEYKKN